MYMLKIMLKKELETINKIGRDYISLPFIIEKKRLILYNIICEEKL